VLVNIAGLQSILLCTVLVASAPSPYVGEQGRSIKALSQEQIGELLAGKGMGFAKAAELNGYPGPRHVIDMAGQLGLSDGQLQQIQRIFDAMQAQAIETGKSLVDEERRLDELFHSRRVTAESLSAALAQIGKLQGELRRVHLQAHIDTTALLSAEQVAKYATLRGYDPAAGDKEHRHE
jgi:Spy/CpxP family protein refolding chaperone